MHHKYGLLDVCPESRTKEMIVDFSKTITSRDTFKQIKLLMDLLMWIRFPIWWTKCAQRSLSFEFEIENDFRLSNCVRWTNGVVYDSNTHTSYSRQLVRFRIIFSSLSSVAKNSQVSNVSWRTTHNNVHYRIHSRLVFVEQIFIRYLAFIVHIMETWVAVCTLIIRTLCKVRWFLLLLLHKRRGKFSLKSSIEF